MKNKNTTLYQKSFDINKWNHSDKINFLLDNLQQSEIIIKTYLENITNDFPNLTDHSLNHSRWLWEYANIIIGEKENFLNPLEAYILHMCFLIHDSGMCYSILNNKDDIKSDPLYEDFIVRNNQIEELEYEALFYTIRNRHGDYAEIIANNELENGSYIINNLDLREEFGNLIGKISKSHSCNTNYIETEINESYTSPNFPTNWKIDCHKIAYILRTSDAAHIDNLRTPKTNKYISEIQGDSKEHWTFQKKLGFPEVNNENLLIYHSNSPFTQMEQKAWWFCFDALKTLDNELKKANVYFHIKNKVGFKVIGVKSINDTLNLGNNFIKTKDWISLDTNIKVSNPVHLASNLGGIKLYGKIDFALREVIQNSIDALNLYKVLTNQMNDSIGLIQIILKETDGKYTLQIVDNGIGMSENTLVNDLLDFGSSYWKSNKFYYDYEGIAKKGFDSIGKFGIGFFSVFMLGKKISVTSWKYGESKKSMKTLDFYNGLYNNPILREPSNDENEIIKDRGTLITIELDINPYNDTGFIGLNNFENNTLENLVKYFVPNSDVKIIIDELGSISTIEPKSLEKGNINEVLDLVYFLNTKRTFEKSVIDKYRESDIKLIELKDDKRVYGRLGILPNISTNSIDSTSIIISKGIRISSLSHQLLGYINTDQIVTLKREASDNILPYDVLKNWAIEQLNHIQNLNPDYYKLYYNSAMFSFNLFDDKTFTLVLNIENSKNILTFTAEEFTNYIKLNRELKIYSIARKIEDNFEYNGFAFIWASIDFKNLVRDEDASKVLVFEDYLESLLKNFWGGFEVEVENYMETNFVQFLEMPYLSVKKYTKIDLPR